MTCHSQVWNDSPELAPVVESFKTGRPLEWTRVTDLPDFVYFDHSIHVAKGVSCATCHGDVSRMPLTWREESLNMEWCLACHRAPEKFIGPKNAVFAPPETGEQMKRELQAWLELNAPPSPAASEDVAGREVSLQAWLASEAHLQSKTDCSVCHR